MNFGALSYGKTLISIVPFDESRNATIEINVFPYDNAPKFKRERYYNLANENNFHYIIIQMLSTSKGDSFLKIEPERIARPILVRRREVIQEIVKEWIKYLHPFFVWGDNFPIIKKYEPEDSRSRVWGYNYYSEALVQLIGAEKFTDLLLKTNDWYLEYVDNGILLIGDSDPYSMNGKLKNKAKSILKLDKQLAKVIKSKQLVSIDNREAPPKGVIE